MAKKSMDEVKQLIDMGKEKGFLTYDEVNDLLPPDMVSSEQIDDVMSMFGEMDIEVVDSAQKVKIPKVKLDLEEVLANPNEGLVLPITGIEPRNKSRLIFPWIAAIAILGIIAGAVSSGLVAFYITKRKRQPGDGAAVDSPPDSTE